MLIDILIRGILYHVNITPILIKSAGYGYHFSQFIFSICVGHLSRTERNAFNEFAWVFKVNGWRKCQGNDAIDADNSDYRLAEESDKLLLRYRYHVKNYPYRYNFCFPNSRVSCFTFQLTMLENGDIIWLLARVRSYFYSPSKLRAVCNIRKTAVRLRNIV